jgi:glycosyltransferase involved in cell wall biosynthesis
VPALIAGADIFVFASSVETFGITLLEGMTVGVPIACSNRSSLPETLKDAGVYFDPQSDVSIADAIQQLINHEEMRESLALKAQQLARHYSWQQCAAQTWNYVAAQGLKI